jgi:hypothetical protein
MAEDLTRVLGTFRRQMLLLRGLRFGAIALLVLGVMVVPQIEAMPTQAMLAILLGVLIVVGLLAIHSVHVAREVQAGGVLVSIGKLDDAEVWLRRGMTRFGLSGRAKIMAARLLASLLHERGAHEEVIEVCRALLSQPLKRLLEVGVEARLMLADSLLLLGRLGEAHEALMPVYGSSLSLETQVRLLPIQLRYELAAGQVESSVSALREKVRIATLMDSPRAALTHALLAEACRQRNMPAQRNFLAERARLYHDLAPLAQQYPVIAPIASGGDKA